MDFSDFQEFLGPLIFGLIAWLSTYFQKKKKKPNNTLNPTPIETKKDSESSLISDIFLEEDSIKLYNPKIKEEKNVLDIKSDDSENNQNLPLETTKEKSNEKLKKRKTEKTKKRTKDRME